MADPAASDLATLSALSTTLEDVARRLAGMGDRYRDARRDDVAGPLYEAERGVRAAIRHMEQAARVLRGT